MAGLYTDPQTGCRMVNYVLNGRSYRHSTREKDEGRARIVQGLVGFCIERLEHGMFIPQEVLLRLPKKVRGDFRSALGE